MTCRIEGPGGSLAPQKLEPCRPKVQTHSLPVAPDTQVWRRHGRAALVLLAACDLHPGQLMLLESNMAQNRGLMVQDETCQQEPRNASC
jgi:hypothetical protein